MRGGLYTLLLQAAKFDERVAMGFVADIYHEIIHFQGVAKSEPVWTEENTIADVAQWLSGNLHSIRRQAKAISREADVALFFHKEEQLFTVEVELPVTKSLQDRPGLMDMSFLEMIRKKRILHKLAIDVIRTVATHIGFTAWSGAESLFLEYYEHNLLNGDIEDGESRKEIRAEIRRYRSGAIKTYQDKLNPDFHASMTSHYEPLSQRIANYYTRKEFRPADTYILNFLESAVALLRYEDCDPYSLSRTSLGIDDYFDRPNMPDQYWDFWWDPKQEFMQETVNESFNCNFQEWGDQQPIIREQLKGLSDFPKQPEWCEDLADFLDKGYQVGGYVNRMHLVEQGTKACPFRWKNGFNYNYKSHSYLDN